MESVAAVCFLFITNANSVCFLFITNVKHFFLRLFFVFSDQAQAGAGECGRLPGDAGEGEGLLRRYDQEGAFEFVWHIIH